MFLSARPRSSPDSQPHFTKCRGPQGDPVRRFEAVWSLFLPLLIHGPPGHRRCRAAKRVIRPARDNGPCSCPAG